MAKKVVLWNYSGNAEVPPSRLHVRLLFVFFRSGFMNTFIASCAVGIVTPYKVYLGITCNRLIYQICGVLNFANSVFGTWSTCDSSDLQWHQKKVSIFGQPLMWLFRRWLYRPARERWQVKTPSQFIMSKFLLKNRVDTRQNLSITSCPSRNWEMSSNRIFLDYKSEICLTFCSLFWCRISNVIISSVKSARMETDRKSKYVIVSVEYEHPLCYHRRASYISTQMCYPCFSNRSNAFKDHLI